NTVMRSALLVLSQVVHPGIASASSGGEPVRARHAPPVRLAGHDLSRPGDHGGARPVAEAGARHGAAPDAIADRDGQAGLVVHVDRLGETLTVLWRVGD